MLRIPAVINVDLLTRLKYKLSFLPCCLWIMFQSNVSFCSPQFFGNRGSFHLTYAAFMIQLQYFLLRTITNDDYVFKTCNFEIQK